MGRPSTAKQRLLETASQEFARVGAQAVGVDELCRLAGINKGSFYHFFPSKADLIQACLYASWDDLRTYVFEPAFAPDRAPLERIGDFFDRILGQQRRSFTRTGVVCGCLFCSLGSEMGSLDPEVRATVTEFMDRNLAFLSGAYSEAIENGDLQGDASTLAATTYTLLLGGLLEAKIRQNLAPLEHAKEAALLLTREIA